MITEIKLRYRRLSDKYVPEIIKSEWFLGLGPCGEVVKEMWAGFDKGHFIIQQITDQSVKEFIFKESDIVGPVTLRFSHEHRPNRQLQNGNLSAPMHARIGTSGYPNL